MPAGTQPREKRNINYYAGDPERDVYRIKGISKDIISQKQD